jgi:hydroxymethylbilane synthase
MQVIRNKQGGLMIRIGSRKSPLALIQAELVKKALVEKTHLTADEIEIVPMTSTGDQVTDRKLMLIGGKGLFTKEIEDALLRREVDLATHSMKDVATQLPGGLVIPCLLPRHDVRDAWLSHKADHPRDLAPGLRVGTASLRRAAQILHMNPHVEIVTFRGNVQTRMRKLEEGEADGTILAMAGLERLGLEHLATRAMTVEEMLPAPAQGAVAVQCREGDLNMLGLLAEINDSDTRTCVEIERTFLEQLDGSCRTPIAALATLNDGMCKFSGYISDPQGKIVLREEIIADVGEMRGLVAALAQGWREEYATELFREEF